MQQIPPYLQALLTLSPALLRTKVMFREDAARMLGEAILSAPEWGAFLAGLGSNEVAQIRMEQGRMAHDLLTGVHLAMAQHAPELPWVEHLDDSRVIELSRIPRLKTISPALAQAVAARMGTALA